MDTMSLVITETNNMLQQVTIETETSSVKLLKSLEEFQVLTNEALTKLIQSNESDSLCDEEDLTGIDADSDGEQVNEQCSPKKRKT